MTARTSGIVQAGALANVPFMIAQRLPAPIAAAAASVALLLAGPLGCGGEADSPVEPEDLSDVTVTVGYVERPESELLAAIYARALADRGAEVERVPLASEDEGAERAAAGDLDLYPDETGRVFTAFAGGRAADPPAPDEVDRMIAEALAERGLAGLAPAPAGDDTRVACATTTALDLELRTLSDLAPVADQLTYAASAEHVERPAGLPALRRAYGIDFGRVLTVPAGAGYARIERGQAACTHGLGTDPELAAAGLTVLEDDLGTFQPLRLQPFAVANADFIASAPDLVRTTLDEASAALTEPELRRLRARVEIEGSPVSDVAAAFLG